MKRILAILSVLIISLTCGIVFAEEIPQDEYITLDKTGLEMWITPELAPYELTEEDLANNYIAFYMNETNTRTVEILFIPDYPSSIEEYADGLPYFENFTDITAATINDIPCLTYIAAYSDSVVFKVTMISAEKDFVEISFSGYDDPEYKTVIEKMAQSIRAKD